MLTDSLLLGFLPILSLQYSSIQMDQKVVLSSVPVHCEPLCASFGELTSLQQVAF